MANKDHAKTHKIVGVALFSAIVIVLQLVGGLFKVGAFSLSFVLVPIVVGAAVYGVWAGAWLGLVFGVAVLLTGDASAFIAVDPLATVAVVLVKGIGAGVLTGLVFKLTEKLNKYVSVLASAVICPVANTGIFLIGCKLFFMETVAGWAEAMGFGANVGSYMILGLCGVNFLIELAINLVLGPIIIRLIGVGKKENI